MSIKVSQAFERTSANPIDVTLALTKAQMLTVNDNLMPAYYFTICQDDGDIYLYDKTATASVTTGKFKKFSGGGGGGGSEVFSTTATLDADINDTTTVLAADLPGVSFSDITVGITLIRDAKGTIGLVTAKNSTTDVTVTTATTSTPTKELTQAEYDALTEVEKKNGTIYFITDNYVGSTYVGAYDTIYSTTERVVGSYMGKPLYQKTINADNIMSTAGVHNIAHNISNIDYIASISGTAQNSDGQTLHLPYVDTTSATGQVILSANRTDIFLNNGIAYSAYSKIYVTIQYTKTTDSTSPVEYASPNDYSTSEKIVGTWVDGKPIYQKTIDLGTELLPGASSTLLVPSVISSNLDNTMDVIDCTITMITANAHGSNPCELYRSGSSWYWRCLESWSAGGSGNSYLTVKYTKSST